MNKSNLRFYIYAKTCCPRRRLEATKLFDYLVKNNLNSVNSPKDADIIFIHTCGGFESFEDISIKTIQKSIENKSAKVIVTGCLPKINPIMISSPNMTILKLPEEAEKLDSMINAKILYSEVPESGVVHGIHDLYRGTLINRTTKNGFKGFINSCYEFSKIHLKKQSGDEFSNRTYVLEIAKGCLGNCTYCSIKKAMPKFRSFSEEEILERYKTGLKSNYTNFAVVAGDIGCYGLDIDTNLPNLLKKIFAVKTEVKPKFILVDLNVRWLGKYYPDFLPIVKANADKISKIILPIQSGSNKILKYMRRQYEINEVTRLLVDFRSNVPGVKLETHFIVGFPGETEEDLQDTINLVEQIKFDSVAIYSYEDRPGTIASRLPDKVDGNIIRKRVKILNKVVQKNRQRN